MNRFRGFDPSCTSFDACVGLSVVCAGEWGAVFVGGALTGH